MFSLIYYFDVWGNQEDGWEVNDQTIVINNLNIPSNISNEELINKLIDMDYLSNENVRVEWYSDMMCEIFSSANDKPLYGLIHN